MELECRLTILPCFCDDAMLAVQLMPEHFPSSVVDEGEDAMPEASNPPQWDAFQEWWVNEYYPGNRIDHGEAGT